MIGEKATKKALYVRNMFSRGGENGQPHQVINPAQEFLMIDSISFKYIKGRLVTFNRLCPMLTDHFPPWLLGRAPACNPLSERLPCPGMQCQDAVTLRFYFTKRPCLRCRRGRQRERTTLCDQPSL